MAETVHFPDSMSRNLYKQALAGQWSAGSALEWSQLSFDHLSPSLRRAMATIYGDILYAEAFGVGVTGRMAELAPEGFLREFAHMQTVDEARHADFFARVMAKLGEPSDTSFELAQLRAELEHVVDYDELMLHGQVVETAARVLFIANGKRALELMQRAVKLPGAQGLFTLVRAVVDLVGRDESRHIAFGIHSLRLRLAGCSVPERHALEQRARVSAQLMYGAFARRKRELAVLGSSPEDVLEQTWRALRVQLGRLELDIGDPPLEKQQP